MQLRKITTAADVEIIRSFFMIYFGKKQIMI